MSHMLIDWASKHLFTIVAGATIVPVILYGIYVNRRSKNLPPGPYGYPYVGSTYELTSDLKGDFKRLGKKYGDIFCLWMGANKYLVVLNSYAAIKESYVSRGSEFAHRDTKELGTLHDISDGIFLSPYDDEHKFSKKIGMQGLRKFVSTAMQKVLTEEFQKMDDVITANRGKPINMVEYFENIMTNVISSMLFGKTYPHDHPEFQSIKSGCKSHFDSFVESFMPAYFGNLLFTGKGKQPDVRQIVDSFHRYIQKEVEMHRSTLDPANPRDVIDLYLKDGALESIGMEKLCNTIMIFTPDQIGTVITVFAWMLINLIKFPQYQDKIFKETESCTSLGDNGMITIDNRKNMPFTEAFIMEILRLYMALDVGMFCKVTKPTKLMGYTIPEWAVIIPNYSAVHMDPALFAEPHVFKPERFLKDGKACSREGFIPFGVGRRMCIGDFYMRNFLFFMLANSVRQYNIDSPNNMDSFVQQRAKDGFSSDLDSLKIMFKKRT